MNGANGFLLLLPLLVGGYAFQNFFHLMFYRARTLSGYRLLVEAAAIGVLPLAASVVSSSVLDRIVPRSSLPEWWSYTASGLALGDYLLATFLAVVFAVLAAAASNLVVGFRYRDLVPAEWFDDEFGPVGFLSRIWEASRHRALEVAVAKVGNPLHALLTNAALTMHRENEDPMSVGLSLKSRKLYAGWVIETPSLLNPHSEADHVSILPILSGYRDPEDLGVRYTYAYDVDERIDDGRQGSVVIPLDQIESARPLEKEDYQEVLNDLED